VRFAENHHCSIAFRILCRPECNIFKEFSGDEFRALREGMIRCILATDMARHNEILEQFREITPVFDFSNTMHANLVRARLLINRTPFYLFRVFAAVDGVDKSG